ncbi:MAG: BolA family transcriptional regulator [Aestuariivita sp.]|nr:BolA family transcriptional regulator [Aestuariivita sp.]
MRISEEISQKLMAVFSPRELEVVDDSKSHRGHIGFKEGEETHFNVKIRSSQFKDQSRIERHRSVHDALGAELLSRIHALSLDIAE